jgi:hypothetical protein
MRFISRPPSWRASRRVGRCGRLSAGALLAGLAGCGHADSAVSGQWQLSWQGRIGTEQATVLLQPSGQALSGSFSTARVTAPLSGSVAGPKLAFAVDFPGPPPYRILFSGLAHGDQIEGQALPQDVNGHAFAGHGGEVPHDYYSWSARRMAP